MTDIDRTKLAETVSEKSPLSLDQVEKLFGEIGADNKAVVWRFLNMARCQQDSIWQAYLRVKHIAPEFKIENIR
jgi:hypothetical protein